MALDPFNSSNLEQLALKGLMKQNDYKSVVFLASAARYHVSMSAIQLRSRGIDHNGET